MKSQQISNLPSTLLILLLCSFMACQKPIAPEPSGAVPAKRQLDWHQWEYYGFVHFTVNTFTNKEWGFGDEKPSVFNPTELDVRQWARICKEAGMKTIIITAKHHDGFCLWPSAYTEHSVKNSPWKNGEGDLIRELSDACKEYGLKLGIYYSPWDRNHADYGSDKYITYMRDQLKELLTNYGEISEVWFDGANGGTGYYGGSYEERRIDRATYYDWENTRKLIRELQPNAVMFSDAGPDIRWIGNEHGYANETNWSKLDVEEFYPGTPRYKELTEGHENGTHWVPAECDVSIRPGWYYHPQEDDKVKTLYELAEIYYRSVGRGASLLLNIPVDTRGLIHENDSTQMMKLAKLIRSDFDEDLAFGKTVTASNSRQGFSANHITDGDNSTYWAGAEGEKSSELILDLEEENQFNRLSIQEFIELGQRVKEFKVEAWVDDAWKTIKTGTTIGYKRILRFDAISTNKVKVSISASNGTPLISTIGLYLGSPLVAEPTIRRNKKGTVRISVKNDSDQIFYTLDGSEPGRESSLYKEPFELLATSIVKARAFGSEDQVPSEIVTKSYGPSKSSWKIVKTTAKGEKNPEKIIDDNEKSGWYSLADQKLPVSVTIDLGETHLIKGITYLPIQGNDRIGMISDYTCYISTDNRNWQKVAEGEFDNIRNNPIQQNIEFEGSKPTRFIKLEVRRIAYQIDHEGKEVSTIGFAEIGVIP